jgi:hypothetical protein
LGGRALDKGFKIAKEKMAPNKDAPKDQPIFKPRYVFEAAELMLEH